MILRLRANPLILKVIKFKEILTLLFIAYSTCAISIITNFSFSIQTGREGSQRFTLGFVQRKEGTSSILSGRRSAEDFANEKNVFHKV
jgi:hypothetical protein